MGSRSLEHELERYPWFVLRKLPELLAFGILRRRLLGVRCQSVAGAERDLRLDRLAPVLHVLPQQLLVPLEHDLAVEHQEGRRDGLQHRRRWPHVPVHQRGRLGLDDGHRVQGLQLRLRQRKPHRIQLLQGDPPRQRPGRARQRRRRHRRFQRQLPEQQERRPEGHRQGRQGQRL